MRLLAFSITAAFLVTLAAMSPTARATPPPGEAGRAQMAPTWMVPTLAPPPEMVAGSDIPREPEDSEPRGRMSLLDAPAQERPAE